MDREEVSELQLVDRAKPLQNSLFVHSFGQLQTKVVRCHGEGESPDGILGTAPPSLHQKASCIFLLSFLSLAGSLTERLPRKDCMLQHAAVRTDRR